MLAVGATILSLFALMLALVAAGMKPFGGIPWSWDFIRLNVFWAALLLSGLILTGLAACLFLCAHYRSNSD
jgi:hypothetical protein